MFINKYIAVLFCVFYIYLEFRFKKILKFKDLCISYIGLTLYRYILFIKYTSVSFLLQIFDVILVNYVCHIK